MCKVRCAECANIERATRNFDIKHGTVKHQSKTTGEWQRNITAFIFYEQVRFYMGQNIEKMDGRFFLRRRRHGSTYRSAELIFGWRWKFGGGG